MTKRTTTESDDDDLGDPPHADLAGRSQPFLKMWWDIEKMGHRKVKCPFSIAMLVYQSVSNTDFGFFFGPYGPSSVVWFIPSEKGDQTKKIITGKNNPHVLPNKKNEKCFFFKPLWHSIIVIGWSGSL